MKIRWWYAVAVAGVFWLGRQFWSSAYEAGFNDGLQNLDLQMQRHDELSDAAAIDPEP